MTKAVITIGAVILILLLTIPMLALWMRGDENAEGDPSTHTLIPSPKDAPPQWDAQALAGTAWEADMRTAPEGRHRRDVLFQWRFLANDQVTLDIVDVEEPKPGQQEQDLEFRQFLHDALLPRFDGTYHVEGSQIHVEVEMLQQPRRDVIEIRGADLYYHGAQVREMVNE